MRTGDPYKSNNLRESSLEHRVTQCDGKSVVLCFFHGENGEISLQKCGNIFMLDLKQRMYKQMTGIAQSLCITCTTEDVSNQRKCPDIALIQFLKIYVVLFHVWEYIFSCTYECVSCACLLSKEARAWCLLTGNALPDGCESLCQMENLSRFSAETVSGLHC